MLTLTEKAQAAVQDLTKDVEQPSAGLRIASEQDQLAVSVVTQPQLTDVVVDAGDARVYLAQDTAAVLDDQTLDAAQTPEGVGFTFITTVLTFHVGPPVPTTVTGGLVCQYSAELERLCSSRRSDSSRAGPAGPA